MVGQPAGLCPQACCLEPGSLGLLVSLLELTALLDRDWSVAIPRASKIRPEDSTFWLLLPGSGSKFKAIKGDLLAPKQNILSVCMEVPASIPGGYPHGRREICYTIQPGA